MITRRAWLAAALALATPVDARPRVASSVGTLIERLDALRAARGTPAYGVALEGMPGGPQAFARGTRAGLDETAVFRIGSITKTFTALAAMRLAAAQHLDLDNTPLRRLVADTAITNPWEASTPLTTAMLLEHTAGLGELTRREWEYADPRPLSLREGLALDPASRVVRWKPGVQHVYSNASPGPVAWLIEQRQPLQYPQFCAQQVFAPLGLRETGFLPTEPSARRLVPGYRADGRTPIPYWHQHILAYGALHASPRDMLQLLRLFADGWQGRRNALLNTAQLQRLRTPTTSLAARTGLGIGYGLGVYGALRNGFVFWGHGGDGDGYLSRFGALPDHGRGYFVGIDTDDPPQLARMRQLIEAWLVADLPPPQPTTAVDIDASQFVGTYLPGATRFGANRGPLRVRRSARGLRLDGALRAELLPAAPVGAFRRRQDSLATSIFAAEEGQLYLQGEFGNFLRISADPDHRPGRQASNPQSPGTGYP